MALAASAAIEEGDPSLSTSAERAPVAPVLELVEWRIAAERGSLERGDALGDLVVRDRPWAKSLGELLDIGRVGRQPRNDAAVAEGKLDVVFHWTTGLLFESLGASIPEDFGDKGGVEHGHGLPIAVETVHTL